MIKIQIVIFLMTNRDQMVIIKIFKDFKRILIHLIFSICFLGDNLINKFFDINIKQDIVKEQDIINNKDSNNNNKIHLV